jgi:hypothetical protein
MLRVHTMALRARRRPGHRTPQPLKPPVSRTDKQVMQIYLDEQRCDVHADSVAEAVTAAARIATARGRTITDVLVDGRRWNAEALGAAQAQDTAADEVRLSSANARDLVCQTFSDAAHALTEASELQRHAAELLQADRMADAMGDLGRAMEIWGSVHQAVDMGAEMAALDLEPHRGVIDGLAERLRSMRGALEQRDIAALADTLLYDLPDVVTEWRSLLHELTERVRGGSK